MTGISNWVRRTYNTGEILNSAWPTRGIAPALDALAAEHAEVVTALRAIEADRPEKPPTLAEYNQACQRAIAAGEAVPEPPATTEPDPIVLAQWAARHQVAEDAVLASAQRIVDAIAQQEDEWWDGSTMEQRRKAAEQRVAAAKAELAEANREASRVRRLRIWLTTNRTRPFVDPTPDYVPVATDGNVLVGLDVIEEA